MNNESSEIIRMFEREFDAIAKGAGTPSVDFYPEALRDEIDEINAFVYPNVNNGVYRCRLRHDPGGLRRGLPRALRRPRSPRERGSASSALPGRRSRSTEADWRLFTTLVRFDPVYVGHFKCNLRRIADYAEPAPATCGSSTRSPGIAETVNIDPHQAALLREPPVRSTRPASCRWDADLGLDRPHDRAALS